MGKRGSVAVLLACEVGAMAVWFASAVAAALIRRDAGGLPGTAWLTSCEAGLHRSAHGPRHCEAPLGAVA